MKYTRALNILKQHNAWRRDQHVPNSYEMVHPKELGEAIDIAVYVLKKVSIQNKCSRHIRKVFFHHPKRSKTMEKKFKKDLIKDISTKRDTTNKQAKEYVEDVITTIREYLEQGHDITLPGLGTFKIKERAEKVCRNPQTNEKIKVEAHKAISFRPESSLAKHVR